MNKKVKKIWSSVTSVLVGLIVILAVLLAGIRLLGFTPLTVLSGSMSPEINPGSVVYVRKCAPQDIREGDVISYMLNESTVSTHRVVEVINDSSNVSGTKYTVKGDANAEKDEKPVVYGNVIGKYSFHVPYIGFIAEFIKNPPGTYIAICAGLVLLVLIFFPEVFPEKKKEKAKEKVEETSSPNDTL